MTKICFTPLLTRPQGCQGCQKIWTTKLKSTLVSWSAKIQPKLKKLWKTVKIEQKLSKKPCFLKVFQILFNLGRILEVKLTQGIFSLVFQIFWHPCYPWVSVNSELPILLCKKTTKLAKNCRFWDELICGWLLTVHAVAYSVAEWKLRR